jgi:hypothetical protein
MLERALFLRKAFLVQNKVLKGRQFLKNNGSMLISVFVIIKVNDISTEHAQVTI